MNLDPKILPGKRPLTCFDTEQAEKYIGKLCYICDEYDYFHALALIKPTILKGVEDCEMPFYDSDKQAEFCLPAEWVKQEQKYRPYKNAQELFEDIGVYIGDTIHFRSKAEKTENHALITSYITLKDGTEKIYLGGACYYTTQELFDSFELRSRDEWIPFGIEEQV